MKLPKFTITYVDFTEKEEDKTFVSVLKLIKTSKKSVTYEVIDYKIINHKDKLKEAVIVKTRKVMDKFKEQYKI